MWKINLREQARKTENIYEKNIKWLKSYLSRIENDIYICIFIFEESAIFLSTFEEIKYLINHIEEWVSDDPDANIRAVKEKLILLMYLESHSKAVQYLGSPLKVTPRGDFALFISSIIKSLKEEKLFGAFYKQGWNKFERRLENLFEGLEEGELITPQIKEYLKRLTAGFSDQNKEIIEFLKSS